MSKPASIFSVFGTDREAEENGKWFVITDEISFKLRRFKSAHATKVRESLEKPYERLRKNGAIPADAMKKVVLQTMANSIIVDWKGVFDVDGNELLFTPEIALDLLEALPEMADELASLAAQMDNFREEDDSETLGN